MSQGHVIDIMTYNSYSLQYYSFGKEKTMRLDLTNHTSTKAGPKKMTRGQILSHATRIFNVNPIPKCARIPRFWEGFNWGSPTARIFGVAKTE